MTGTQSSTAAIISHLESDQIEGDQNKRGDTSTPLYSTAQICELIGCNRVSLWRMCRDGRFPKPLEIMSGKRAWPKSDYDGWLVAQIAKRNAMAQ